MTERLSQLIKASKKPAKTFISGSAVGYYGDQGQTVVTESDMPHAEFTNQLCKNGNPWHYKPKVTKLAFVCYEPESCWQKKAVLRKLLPIFKAGLGGPIGKGKQYIP